MYCQIGMLPLTLLPASVLVAEGPLSWLGRRALDTTLDVSQFAGAPPLPGQVMNAMLDRQTAGQQLWPTADRRIDAGRMKLNAGTLASNGVIGNSQSLVKARTTLTELARADGGIVYGDRAGAIVYEHPARRFVRLQLALPTVSDDDHVVDLARTSYIEGLYNIFETDAVQETVDPIFVTKDFGAGVISVSNLEPSDTVVFSIAAIEITGLATATLEAVRNIRVGALPSTIQPVFTVQQLYPRVLGTSGVSQAQPHPGRTRSR